ncbi:adenylate/guanylate cyclase with GAF sensor(s) [Leptospira ryugenii]|uniref:Adenylate cyclase n=1 Tax=Leptospira ryugenii TaxID=1917863 RepID=A0A2P2E1G4_9LEPT|nr:adenylate/guanylate cyclase domain-containing protein [Leptospira ryugenii]GBF50720.1 adenylate/guanylate cyclase with GAF sensor(s) [Leptospira ryugenii]
MAEEQKEIVWQYGRRQGDSLPGVILKEDGRYYVKSAFYANLNEQVTRLSMLMDVSRSIMAEIDLDSLLQLIMQKVTLVMNADRSSLFLVDHEKKQLWTRVAQGASEIRLPLGEGIAGDVALTGKTANIPDAYEDIRFNKEFDIKTGYRTKSILCMGIRNQSGKIIGTIQVLNKKDETAFSESDEALLAAFCGLAGISLENARAYEELQLERDSLEIRVQERTKELASEKKKSDELLLNILPFEIAEELKTKGEAEPRNFEKVTVMFTDFKGFTQVAETMTAESLVSDLDNCFYYFDEVMDRRKVEKIKTIGDSYMCAGGLPNANNTNPIEVVLAAMEIKNFMEKLKEIKTNMGQAYWELRIGIHTGPVIAGVVGKRKFAFDIWGDTVNTASRMESSGYPGEINISEATYQEIKDFFVCEARGKIAAKNKGDIEMYFVKRIIPELSNDEGGQVPNQTFFQKLERLGS